MWLHASRLRVSRGNHTAHEKHALTSMFCEACLCLAWQRCILLAALGEDSGELQPVRLAPVRLPESVAPGTQYGYRMSKAALNCAGATLARDLRADGIHVAIVHPGAVRASAYHFTCQAALERL